MKKYTDQLHPNQLPANKPKLVIYSTDERNNSNFLSKNPNTQVIEAVDAEPEDDFDFFSSAEYELDAHEYDDDHPEETYIPENPNQIGVPENLAIDINSYRLQSDASDGSVLYSANMTFLGVANAEDYEVRLSIVNDN